MSTSTSTRNDPTYLRRYTDLPALLHILSDKKITFLDPKTWDDQNDSYFMSLYREEFELKTLLAICFSQAPETYHHWRVFSNGSAGVCILFDKAKLLKNLEVHPGVKCKKVKYYTLSDAEKHSFKNTDLPFAKRYGYKPEREFRAIYQSRSKELLSLDVDIDLNSIRSISLSPWMKQGLEIATIKAIKKIDGCQNLRVFRSTLISNDLWKSMGLDATTRFNY